MNPELKAIMDAQDKKLATHNAKLEVELSELKVKVEWLEALAEEAE